MPVAIKGTGGGSVTLSAGAAAADTTLTLPAVNGTVLTTAATITVAQGGTGAATLAANNVLLGNGTSALQTVAPGTSGNVLNSSGTTWQSSALSGGTGISISGLTVTNTGVLSFSGGSTGLTPATATTGAIALAGTLAVANGGTGLATLTAANNALYSTSSSAMTAGTLPVAAGGTGLTSPGTVGNVLTSTGSAWASTAPAATATSIANGTSNVTISSSGGSIRMTTAGTSAVTVNTSQNLQFNSGYGSVATAYGCRAWVTFVGSTAVIRANGNVSSITRNGLGDYTVNFTTAMPDVNYAPQISCGTGLGDMQGTYAVGSCRFRTYNDAGSTIDPAVVSVVIFR
jgi:hypothetical protein